MTQKMDRVQFAHGRVSRVPYWVAEKAPGGNLRQISAADTESAISTWNSWRKRSSPG